MSMNNQSSILPRHHVLLIIVVISLLALSLSPSCSLALGSGSSSSSSSSKHLLHFSSHDHHDLGYGSSARFKLLHWSHPEAPHFVPGFSFLERFKLSIERSKARSSAGLMSRRQLSSSALSSPSPAPSPADASSTLSLDPLPEGEYAMEISLGTPPQKFAAIADTGSDVVWVQCAGCSACQPQNDAFFTPSNSSTYTRMPCADLLCTPRPAGLCDTVEYCTYYYDYVSGGINIANMSYDTITLNTTVGTPAALSTHFAFGCAIQATFPLGGLDGLIGLGRGQLSFPSQLGSIFGNQFSYCMASIYDSNSTSSPIVFGAIPFPNTTLYTPMLKNPNSTYLLGKTSYYMNLTAIKVNGVAVDIVAGTFDMKSNGTGGVILDSGTTIGVFVAAGYNTLLAKITEVVTSTLNLTGGPNLNLGLDLCYDLSNVSRPVVWPVVTMVFEGFELELPQDNVFIGGPIFGAGYSSVYCLAFAASGDDRSFYGNVLQQNFHILYDMEGSRIGFAPAKCDAL